MINTIRENHIMVSRTARYFTLGERQEGTREVWYVFHGYGQLAGHFVKHFQCISAPSRLIVAPEGLSRFYQNGVSGRVGASWMTREDRLNEIADYQAYLNTLHREIVGQSFPDHLSVTILGFSQGCATACRWISTGSVRPERLILWAGSIPRDIDFREAGGIFSRLRLQLVVGDHDPYATPDLINKEKAHLDKHNLSYQFISYSGDHRLNREVLEKLAEDGES